MDRGGHRSGDDRPGRPAADEQPQGEQKKNAERTGLEDRAEQPLTGDASIPQILPGLTEQAALDHAERRRVQDDNDDQEQKGSPDRGVQPEGGFHQQPQPGEVNAEEE